MIPRAIARRLRPLWVAVVGSALWANRVDLKRWTTFARRALTERRNRPPGELLTEARVRLAISVDPMLRNDRQLKDLTVNNGTLALLTTTSSWSQPAGRTKRLSAIKGVNEVTSSAVGVFVIRETPS